MDAKKLRLVIREEVTDVIQTQLEPIKRDIGGLKTDVNTLKEDVKEVKKDLKELREDVDAARGDIETIRIDVQAIKEKQGMYHARNKREIDEIKTHLGLPLMPDTPEV